MEATKGLATTRRGVLARAGWLAVLPMTGFGFGPLVSRAEARIVLPQSAMTLRRVLERDLADGKAIVVTREWLCEFARNGDGAVISGRQTAVDVDAPPALAPLAEIEKNRVADSLFPATLDGSGRIVSMGGGNDSTAIQKAIEVAKGMLASVPSEAIGGDVDPHVFMAQLAGTAAQAVSRVPQDLFYPATALWSDTRPIAFEDGEHGEIEVRMVATTRDQTGLLERSERVVRTRIGGRDRHSREVWSLTPIV